MAKEKYEISIKVDTNDADYNTEVSIITKDELELIKPLIKQIKKFKPYTTTIKYSHSNQHYTREHRHNYPYGECLRKDLGEKSPEELYEADEEVFNFFHDLMPYNEYGFHTIESIEVTPYVKKEKLL